MNLRAPYIKVSLILRGEKIQGQGVEATSAKRGRSYPRATRNAGKVSRT